MAKQAPSGTSALLAASSAGVPHTVHAYAHDAGAPAGYGMAAAEALGLPPDQVFKTLLADVDGTLTVAVVPVNTTLDLKALARAVGGRRAAMADRTVAERATGYVVGGISPLGQKHPHPTVIDESAELYDVVYVSGGRRGLDIGLAPGDLIALTGATVADVARG